MLLERRRNTITFKLVTPYDKKYFCKYDNAFVKKHKGTFDLIVSVDVLEHLSDPLKTFRDFNELLRPGGYMIHSTPLLDDFLVYGGHADTALHTCFFSKKSLKKLCDKTGFGGEQIIERHGVGGYKFIKL